MGRTNRIRARRLLALVVSVLWLLAVEVLPALHLADHADDHTHAPNGAIVHDHDHQRPDLHAAKPGLPVGRSVSDASRSGHTAGGIAHHAMAIHQPASPIIRPFTVEPASWEVPLELEGRPRSVALARPAARGPPTS